jgi:hypothetical protein
VAVEVTACAKVADSDADVIDNDSAARHESTVHAASGPLPRVLRTHAAAKPLALTRSVLCTERQAAPGRD